MKSKISVYGSTEGFLSVGQSPASVLDRKQRMFIWPAGYFTVVHFPDDDVTVLWDRKTTVHVQVGPRWQVRPRLRPRTPTFSWLRPPRGCNEKLIHLKSFTSRLVEAVRDCEALPPGGVFRASSAACAGTSTPRR